MSPLEVYLQISPPFRRKVDGLWLEKVARVTLEGRGLPNPTEVDLLITDDEVVAELNNKYRKVPETTDVLAFSTEPGNGSTDFFLFDPDGVHHLGEVVVSYPQAGRQCREFGTSPKEEVTLLVIHGLLHLMGYDHERNQDQEAMRAEESEILTHLGMKDIGLVARGRSNNE